MSVPTSPKLVLGTSLKTYFSHARTLEWLRAVAAILSDAPAVASGDLEFFTVPTFPALKDAVATLAPHPVGAQDVAAYDPGAYTGEVSAAELAEIGVTMAEIGHAERRRLFGETDADVRAKCAQALAHHLTPILCVGEPDQGDPKAAADRVVSQVRAALLDEPERACDARVLIAYEPYWAIGAPQPAPASYVQDVCALAKEALAPQLPHAVLLYGGSAGPGTLTALGSAVDGLFLGRFVHDPANVARVITEASELIARR